MYIFKPNPNIDRTAYMNWRIDSNTPLSVQLAEIGEGYLLASKAAIEYSLKDTFYKNADVMIFPALFNLIHAIEVYIKAINIDLEFLLKQKEIKTQGKHNIEQSFQMLMSKIREFEGKEAVEQFADIEVIIGEIYGKTNKMDFARYPIDDKKENHFYVDAKDNEVVDLDALLQFVNSCIDIFARMHGYFYEKSYVMQEMIIESKLMSQNN